MQDGRVVCASPNASCPRGAERAGARCARPPRCPAGSLFDGLGCRPFVFESPRGPPLVDVGTFLAFAIGIDGGAGTAALCAPLETIPQGRHHGADKRDTPTNRDNGETPDGGDAPHDREGGGERAGPPDRSDRDRKSAGIRIHVALSIPNQDLTRLSVEASVGQRRDQGPEPPRSAELESAIADSARTLAEALRGVGGEANVAAAAVDVTCGPRAAGGAGTTGGTSP
jgi:hypothetical protein